MQPHSRKHTSVSIPKAIFSKLEKIKGRAGFGSVASIVLWCVRKNMYEIDRMIEEIKEADKDGEQNQ